VFLTAEGKCFVELKSSRGGKAWKPYCEFQAGKNKSSFEESLRNQRLVS